MISGKIEIPKLIYTHLHNLNWLLPLECFIVRQQKMLRTSWRNERWRKSLITVLKWQRGRNKNNWRKTAPAMVFAAVVLWFMLRREHTGQLCDVRAVLLSQFYRPLAPCMMHPFTVYHFINTSTTASKMYVNTFVYTFLEVYATCIWMTISFSIYVVLFVFITRTLLIWIEEVFSTRTIKSTQFLWE